MRNVSLVLFGFLLLIAGTSPAHTRDLTFEERVQAQAAIERTYYAHQVGVTRPFADVVPRAALESKVRQYLKQTRALEHYWSTSITAEMLERELQRMAKGTRMPERLLELFRALGDDPLLVQECLARPALVDRLARSFFEQDARIHAHTRQVAEELRADLASGSLDAALEHPQRARVLVESSSAASSAEEPDDARERVRLDSVAFDAWRRGLPREVGAIGPLVEEPDGFLIEVVLEEQAGQAVTARYRVPKQSWESWWAQVAASLDETGVAAVARADASVVEAARETAEAAGNGAPEGSAPCLPDDTWLSGPLDDPPPARYDHSAVWTGTSMIIWGGRAGGSPTITIYQTGARYDPAIDDWTSISPIGAPSARFAHTAVWTGERMIVWGGSAGPPANGGSYDPSTDSWTPITTLSAPAGRSNHTAVWTGTRMVVWGGSITGGDTNTGGRYDPATDSWKPTSTVGAPLARRDHSAVWTGTSMVVWGGEHGGLLNTGGRYDPATDTWTPTSTVGAPSSREVHRAVWTGNLMLIWGGWSGSGGVNTGARYDPATDSWTPTTLVGAPAPRYGHTAVWTGQKMLIWGGALVGGRYDPVADAWTPMTTSGQPELQQNTGVWADGTMIVWGGVVQTGPSTFVYLNTGGRYDPATDTWTPTSLGTAPAQAVNGKVVWTGNLMVLWNSSTGGGARYDPAVDSWTLMSTLGAPTNRAAGSLVWTGNVMIAWGGATGSTYLDSGSRYDPVVNYWTTPTAFTGAPTPRARHSAVWSGSEMIVWGGTTTGGVLLETGGRYDPLTNTWQPMSVDGTPAARRDHEVVWTGDRMIVWAGTASAPLDTGGRYDPSTDTWLPTATSGAPAARANHTMIWTGHRVVVWGGMGVSSVLGDGGRYDPLADSWTSTSVVDAPTPRTSHGAIWTGSQMVVWGGSDGTRSTSTGARYDPLADTWVPTAISSAPTPGNPELVWTGSLMLVWSGVTGGAYAFGHSIDDDGDGLSECGGDCNDGNAAVHPGAEEVCDSSDTDCDPATSETLDHDGDGRTACQGDCAPADGGAFAVPQVIQDLLFELDAVTLSWDSIATTAGNATVYEVAMGLVDQFPVGGGPAEACLASGSTVSTASTASTVPPENSGYWFLVRGRNTCGSGAYGFASDGSEEMTAACP